MGAKLRCARADDLLPQRGEAERQIATQFGHVGEHSLRTLLVQQS
jgi:hypothetical protein